MNPTAIQHYGLLSIAPAALTILLAVWSRRVIESVLSGIALAAWIIDCHLNGPLHACLYSISNTFAMVAGHPGVGAWKGVGLAKDSGRGQLLISVLLLGAFIAVIEKSGGAHAFAERTAKRIKGERGALLTTFAIGLAIFTSAFFGILVSGTAMKPVFDRFKISREKLAYYVDSTAAPTKALIPVSGWIAFMMVLIVENIPSIHPGEGFLGFLKTMPYNLYCWGVIIFTLGLSMQWIPDFGPMKEAEHRVKKLGLIHKPGSTPMIDPKLEEKAHAEVRKGNVSDMMVPLIVSVVFLFIHGIWNGFVVLKYPQLPKIAMDSLEGMTVAFTLGLIVAFVKYTSKGLMKRKEFLDFVIEGSKSPIIGAIMILLAVTLSDLMRAPVPEGLGTAPFIVEAARPYLSQGLLPALTFLVSALLSFSMGTSWGVWAMMMPISVPLALGMGMNPFLVAGAVLSGGAFGDHCSPISDTAVLSSLAANTDHLEHIRTQLPYAMVTAAFALVGYLVLGYL